jgi:hypothetical protein
VPVGLRGIGYEMVIGDTGGVLPPGEEMLMQPGEVRSFFLRLLSQGNSLLAAQPAPPQMVGDQHYIDVLPYGNGQALLVDGIQSGVRYVLETPTLFLPLVVRNF